MFLHSLVNKPGVFGKLLPIQRTALGMQELQKKTSGLQEGAAPQQDCPGCACVHMPDSCSLCLC